MSWSCWPPKPQDGTRWISQPRYGMFSEFSHKQMWFSNIFHSYSYTMLVYQMVIWKILKNIIPTRDGKEILDDFGAFESTEMVRWLMMVVHISGATWCHICRSLQCQLMSTGFDEAQALPPFEVGKCCRNLGEIWQIHPKNHTNT